MGLGTNRGSPSPQGPEHCAQGTTHPEDVSVAAEAITPIAREASADPLTSPHCLAGGLGWGWGRETRPSVQHPYGKLISTYPPRLCSPSSPILSLCACPVPTICLSIPPVCSHVAPLVRLALLSRVTENLPRVTRPIMTDGSLGHGSLVGTPRKPWAPKRGLS